MVLAQCKVNFIALMAVVGLIPKPQMKILVLSLRHLEKTTTMPYLVDRTGIAKRIEGNWIRLIPGFQVRTDWELNVLQARIRDPVHTAA